MRGFATSPGNYTVGLRPRRFLESTIAKMRLDIITGKKLKSKPIPENTAF